MKALFATVRVIGQLLVCFILVMCLTVAFMGLPAVLLMVATPIYCVTLAVCALVAGFILLLGNHTEDWYQSSYK
jgi:hypothetical protein